MSPRPDTGSSRALKGRFCTGCGTKLKRRPDYRDKFYCPECDAALYEQIRPTKEVPYQIRMTERDIAAAEFWLARPPPRERLPAKPPRADCPHCGAEQRVKPWWAYYLWLGVCQDCGAIQDCPPVIRWREIPKNRETANG